jgi:Flp pilus assembly protein TadD
MKKMVIAKLTTSALVLSTLMAAGSGSGWAQGPADAKAVHDAAAVAQRASVALTKKQAAKAVTLAETAVSLQPRDARYRMLLGQAYLGAGRFQSAEQTFSDTLTLDPERERAALDLALAQIAQGRRDAAKSTLADYRDKLPAADFGLAVALAGDADEAVRILEFATRAPDATAKTRQNLALAYALAGKWNNARVMAVQDLSPDEADTRVAGWAQFARPAPASDQVAALLGVTPRLDGGMPTRLALARGNPAIRTASAPEAVAPVAVAPAPLPVPVAVATAETQPAFEVAATTAMASPVSRGRPSPAPVLIRAEPRPVRQAVIRPLRPAATVRAAAFHPAHPGKFVVQIGAFENASSAQRAWNRLSSRINLANYDAVNGAARFRNASLIRVAIGGLDTRADANRLCARIKQTGSVCFVRVQEGDAPARWVQRHTFKVAAR